MASKSRERTSNKPHYTEKQKKKKANQKAKQIRQHSRERRNYIRQRIRQFSAELSNNASRYVIIILEKKDKTERILFKIEDIGNGISYITLPIIEESVIKQLQESTRDAAKHWEDVIRSLATERFGVDVKTITDTNGLLILEDCTVVTQKSGYLALNTKSYCRESWYWNGERSLSGQGLYNGKQLQTFFEIDGAISKTYVHSETLFAILAYRTASGRMNYDEWARDYDKEHTQEMLEKSGVNKLVDKLFPTIFKQVLAERIVEYLKEQGFVIEGNLDTQES